MRAAMTPAMTRLAGTADARFVRFILALSLLISLVITPFAHALAMPVAPTAAQPGQEAAMACNHADPTDQPEPGALQTGDCCCKPGTACHCAASIALPAATRTLAAAPIDAYFIVLPHFAIGNLPPPEPPPPRG